MDVERLKDAHALIDEMYKAKEADGFTDEYYDQFARGELAEAAHSYRYAKDEQAVVPASWPWPSVAWKPGNILFNVTKAGMLYMAEHNRLQRINNTVQAARRMDQVGEVAAQLAELLQEMQELIDATPAPDVKFSDAITALADNATTGDAGPTEESDPLPSSEMELVDFLTWLNEPVESQVDLTVGERGALVSHLNKLFGDDRRRRAFIRWAFGVESINAVQPHQLRRVWMWLSPVEVAPRQFRIRPEAVTLAKRLAKPIIDAGQYPIA